MLFDVSLFLGPSFMIIVCTYFSGLAAKHTKEPDFQIALYWLSVD